MFKGQAFQFDPSIEPYQLLTLRAIVDLEVMAMKMYSVFPTDLALLEPHNKIV